MKRGRAKDTLTGGSGDVNPQHLQIISGAQTANDAFGSAVVGLPIPRFPIREGRQLVMEILGVTFSITAINFGVAFNTYFAALSTNPTTPASATAALADGRTLVSRLEYVQFAAGTTLHLEGDKYYDMTDNAGHGVLVATDNLYFYIDTVNTGNATFAVVADVEYRFKEVSLAEYVGIVQSQQ